MMNPEIKSKWVAALRSGEYKQTQHILKDHVGHCCLGVLCEISKAETGFGIPENLDEASKDHHQLLGPTVMKWADLPYVKGDVVLIGNTRDYLADVNDAGYTFTEIADAIEAQL